MSSVSKITNLKPTIIFLSSKLQQDIYSSFPQFFHSLNQVTCQEVYEETGVNIKFSISMDLILHCYNNAFPIKTVCVRNKFKNKWITQGIKVYSKKMQLLDNQRKKTVMEKEDLDYIEHYRKVYRRVIKEAKRSENNRYCRVI